MKDFVVDSILATKQLHCKALFAWSLKMRSSKAQLYIVRFFSNESCLFLCFSVCLCVCMSVSLTNFIFVASGYLLRSQAFSAVLNFSFCRTMTSKTRDAARKHAKQLKGNNDRATKCVIRVILEEA